MTIEMLLFWGFVAGLLVGAALGEARLGRLVLAAVPVAAIIWVAWWQSENPDKLRSTSGLDYVFGALWPSLGAAAGLFAGRRARTRLGGG